MAGYNPYSHFEQVLQACGQFCAAALVIYWAVKLILAVWFALLLILLGVAVVIGVVLLVRHHLREW
jgi:hypothetical protein